MSKEARKLIKQINQAVYFISLTQNIGTEEALVLRIDLLSTFMRTVSRLHFM